MFPMPPGRFDVKKTVSKFQRVSGKFLLTGALFAAAWMSVPAVFAGTYSWTDKSGTFHISDDLSKVPPEYR